MAEHNDVPKSTGRETILELLRELDATMGEEPFWLTVETAAANTMLPPGEVQDILAELVQEGAVRERPDDVETLYSLTGEVKVKA